MREGGGGIILISLAVLDGAPRGIISTILCSYRVATLPAHSLHSHNHQSNKTMHSVNRN